MTLAEQTAEQLRALSHVRLMARVQAIERENALLKRRLAIWADALDRQVKTLDRRVQPMGAAQAERIIWALDSRIRKLEGRKADQQAAAVMQKVAAAIPDAPTRRERGLRLVRCVEQHFELAPGQLFPPGRRLSLPRHIAFLLLCRDLGFSTVQAGKLMHRDHGTVLYGIRQIERKITTTPALAVDVAAIREWARAAV